MSIILTCIEFSMAFLIVFLAIVFYPNTINFFNTYYAFFTTVCMLYMCFDKLTTILFNKKSNTQNKKTKKSKKIYVAGSWNQRHQLKEKMDELRSMGYDITSYWPWLEDRLNNPDDYEKCSEIDINGVTSSDTILIFMTDPMHPYCGTFTEMGCAIGSMRRIILICDGKCTKVEEGSDKNYNFTHRCMQSVFFWDQRIEHVSTYEDALKLLEGKEVKSPFFDFYSGEISKKLDDFSSNLDFDQ